MSLVNRSKKYGVLKDMAVHDLPARAAPRVRVPRAAQPWLGVLGVLVLIELVVRSGIFSSRYFPPMTETGAALVGQLGEGAYWTAILHTMQGWALGLGNLRLPVARRTSLDAHEPHQRQRAVVLGLGPQNNKTREGEPARAESYRAAAPVPGICDTSRSRCR